ncbi:Uncharacterised protein [Klebsiella oxytoca]|nr:Uncharacterised protein [Klebsiella oxytoca]
MRILAERAANKEFAARQGLAKNITDTQSKPTTRVDEVTH